MRVASTLVGIPVAGNGEAQSPREITLELDGRPATSEECFQAQNLATLLLELMSRVHGNDEAAQLLVELAGIIGGPLGDLEGALTLSREAFQRVPQRVWASREYRKAALRARAGSDVITAIEGEAKATSSRAAKAVLHVQRGKLIKRRGGNPEASRRAHLAALETAPMDISALGALEQLALEGHDYLEAARRAGQLSDVLTDSRLKAESGARSARWFEAGHELDEALSRAAAAFVHAPNSPAAGFVLERLCMARGALAQLISLRETQIAEGLVDSVQGWFDIGLLARYRLSDPQLALRAFEMAAVTSDLSARAVALAELSFLLESRGDYERLIEVEEARVELAGSTRERASLWERIVRLHSEERGDPERTALALERALREDPFCMPAIEAAGRLYHRIGNKTRLLETHRLEAELARTSEERAIALRRAGQLLLDDRETIEEGIETLETALAEAPRNLLIFAALERALAREHRWERLLHLYEEELERTREPSRQATLLSQIGTLAADHLGDRKKALESFQRAASLETSGPSYAFVRVLQFLEDVEDSGVLSTLVEELSKQITDSAEVASLMERAAAALEAKGCEVQAVDMYRRALSVAPPSHPVYASAGRAFLRAGCYEDLAHLFDLASRTGPPEDRARWLLKAAEVRQRHLGEVETAEAFLRQALDVSPAHEGVTRALANLLTKRQSWADLRGLMRGDPKSPPECIRRAALAEAVGDEPAALQLYKAAYESGMSVALLPYLRLAMKCESWDVLFEHYRTVEGAEPRMEHARYRAAEIAAERLTLSRDQVMELLDQSRRAEPKTLSASLYLHHLLGESRSELSLEVLGDLASAASDPGSRMGILEQQAAMLEALGRREEASKVYLTILDTDPLHPVASLALELLLEVESNRTALAALLKNRMAEPGDDHLSWNTWALLGRVLAELGSAREAADAFEAAIHAQELEGIQPPLACLVALQRVYGLLGDKEAQRRTVTTLANVLPKGSEKALCLRKLAGFYSEHGPKEEAIRCLEEALNADPHDYEALRQFDRLLTESGQGERSLKAMSRAFVMEEDAGRLAELGAAFAIRLLEAGRVDHAHETLERVLTATPQDLECRMVAAELHQRRGEWHAAARALEVVASHEDAESIVQLEALRRLGVLQASHLSDKEAALCTLERLANVPSNGLERLRARVDVEEALGDPEGACSTLAELVECKDLSEGERMQMLLRLASLQEEKLGDPAAAIRILSRVTAHAYRKEAISHLLRLGETTGRWDLACDALEAALDGSGTLEAEWELTIRRRLAGLLEGPLNRPADAVRHHERVLVLNPNDGQSVRRLAELLGIQNPVKGVKYQRVLIDGEPDCADHYRVLRKCFIALGEEDDAFCAEAVLEGLHAADEEEAYFYRQRRPFLPGEIHGALTEAEQTSLFPEMSHPALRILQHLQQALASVFTVDFGGYGVSPSEEGEAKSFLDIAGKIARLFGVPTPRIYHVASRLGPAVEPGAPPALFLPRDLFEAPKREQQFVCGALLARVAFFSVLGDPNRLNPISGKQVEYLLLAATELSLPDFQAPLEGNAVFEDLKRRLKTHVDDEARKQMAVPARQWLEIANTFSGQGLLDAMNRASARAAVLSALDPAVAVSCFRRYRRMFDAPGSCRKEDELPPAVFAGLSFAVSAAHSAIRRHLELEIIR